MPTPTRCVLAILVVDDNPFVGAALMRYLGLMGHAASWERSGTRAWARLRRGERFDLLLVDVTMAEMNGLELSELALEMDEGLAGRIVAMTGGASPGVLDGFEKLGIEVLSKPFEHGVFDRTLSKLSPRSAS